jgi:hypothetical protein
MLLSFLYWLFGYHEEPEVIYERPTAVYRCYGDDLDGKYWYASKSVTDIAGNEVQVVF